MKRKILIILIIVIFVLIIFFGVFMFYHPTHFAFNDRFVIGSTEEQITERYGEFVEILRSDDGVISKGTYMIRDNTPEWIMSYDDSLWYEIYFENGVAIRVNLRAGYIGG